MRPIRQTWAQTEPWGRERTLAALALLAVATVAALIGAGALNRDGLNIAATLFVYIALAEAWNILAGLSGQVSLGVGAFVGTGAYALGLVMVHAGAGLLAGLVVAAVAGGLLGLILTVPLLRLRGDYFAVGTLAAALALQAWLLNWDFAAAPPGSASPSTAFPRWPACTTSAWPWACSGSAPPCWSGAAGSACACWPSGSTRRPPPRSVSTPGGCGPRRSC